MIKARSLKLFLQPEFLFLGDTLMVCQWDGDIERKRQKWFLRSRLSQTCEERKTVPKDKENPPQRGCATTWTLKCTEGAQEDKEQCQCLLGDHWALYWTGWVSRGIEWPAVTLRKVLESALPLPEFVTLKRLLHFFEFQFFIDCEIYLICTAWKINILFPKRQSKMMYFIC